MTNETRKYLESIREDITKHYCGFTDEGGEDVTLYDYLSDVLDFELTVNSRLEYASCKVWLTLGGPNVCIDTAEKEIKLVWGNERDCLYLDYDICNEIDSFFEDLYNCR